MSKTVRIVMYALSLLTVIGVLAALVVAGGKKGTTQTMQQTAVQQEEQKTEDQSGQTGGPEDLQTAVRPEETDEENQAPQGTIAATEETDGQKVASGQQEEEKTEDQSEQTGDTTTIIFTGDVLFANAFKAGYDANGINGVVSEELLQELNGADILMINNEFPFSDNGVPMEDKQFTFRCSPSYVTALQEMGVDVVSLANNHTLDYGKQALLDTFQTLDGAGILYGGAGETAERAEEVQKITVNGRT